MKLEKLDEKIREVARSLESLEKDLKGTLAVSSRVSGFYRPVEGWNTGKKQEFAERAEYRLED